MFPQEMSSIIFVCVWSMATVGVGLICGFFMGRFYTLANVPKKVKKEREQTLKALLSVMNCTDQLNDGVGTHNSALESAAREIASVESDEKLVVLQAELMNNISQVVESNKKLENDLVVSKYALESQAQELDISRKEARTDALCNVGNRKAVDEAMQFMISRYQSNKKPFGLMMIDIDHFKRINDTFGHQAGDDVLTSISKALNECVRPEDFVGRLGGDEFVIILDGLTDENANLVGTRIRSTIELYDFSIADSGQSTVVTMSMGLAVVGEQDTVETLYDRADKALYKSKELGRNRLYTIVDESKVQISPTVQTTDQETESYESFKASFGETAL